MEQKYPILTHAMTYGLYAGIGMVAIGLLSYFTGSFLVSRFQLLYYFNTAFFTYTSISRYRDTMTNGNINYGRSLGIGTYTIFWSSMIYAFFIFVLYTYIDPSLKEQFINIIEKALQANNYPEDQIVALVQLYKMVLTPFAIAFFELMGKTLMGFFFALLLAFFTRRNTIVYDNNEQQ